MPMFCTDFPVDPARSADDFLCAVRVWLRSAPELDFDPVELDALGAAGSADLRCTDAGLLMVQFSSDDASACAVRLSRREGVLDWVTSATFRGTARLGAWVGVRVDAQSDRPLVPELVVARPTIVMALLEVLGGGTDSELPVASVPMVLNSHQVGLAARAITGRAGCWLPVVYVSSAGHQGYLLDPDPLAQALAGLAHVLVEPGSDFSARLQSRVGVHAVIGGAIAVYWPDGERQETIPVGQIVASPEAAVIAASRVVRTGLVARKGRGQLTWDAVEEEARLRLREQQWVRRSS